MKQIRDNDASTENSNCSNLGIYYNAKVSFTRRRSWDESATVLVVLVSLKLTALQPIRLSGIFCTNVARVLDGSFTTTIMPVRQLLGV